MPADHGRTQRDIVATDDWEVPVLEPDMLGVEQRGNLKVMWLEASMERSPMFPTYRWFTFIAFSVSIIGNYNT